jgi:hypothetical protein
MDEGVGRHATVIIRLGGIGGWVWTEGRLRDGIAGRRRWVGGCGGGGGGGGRGGLTTEVSFEVMTLLNAAKSTSSPSTSNNASGAATGGWTTTMVTLAVYVGRVGVGCSEQ